MEVGTHGITTLEQTYRLGESADRKFTVVLRQMPSMDQFMCLT